MLRPECDRDSAMNRNLHSESYVCAMKLVNVLRKAIDVRVKETRMRGRPQNTLTKNTGRELEGRGLTNVMSIIAQSAERSNYCYFH